MSTWEYRFVVHEREDPGQSGGILQSWSVYEIYYNDRGEIDGWAPDMRAGAEDGPGLVEDLALMLAAAGRDAIAYVDLPQRPRIRVTDGG